MNKMDRLFTVCWEGRQVVKKHNKILHPGSLSYSPAQTTKRIITLNHHLEADAQVSSRAENRPGYSRLTRIGCPSTLSAAAVEAVAAVASLPPPPQNPPA